MRKLQEISNPNSCMSRAKDDEMTFVLLGRDIVAPAVIREWCRLRCLHGKNSQKDPQITEAMECAEAMEKEIAPKTRRVLVVEYDDPSDEAVAAAGRQADANNNFYFKASRYRTEERPIS